MVCVCCVFGMFASYFWKFEKARRTAANRDVFGSAGQNSNTVVPHIFVWGSCFWFCIPPPPSASSSFRSHTTCPHTTCHHTNCSHTPCPHTTCPHTQLVPHLLTHNLSTQTLLTHNLSTHNLSSHNLLTHNLSTLTHTQLVHTQLVHTYSHTTCPHRPCSQLVHFHLAGLVLGDIDLHFVGQAWHVWHWAGSGGALGPEWPGWSPRTCSHTTCQHFLTHNLPTHNLSTHNLSTLTHTQLVHTDLAHNLSTFTWQAWYLVTSTFTLWGRRGTYGIGLAPVARLGRSGRGGRRGCWRGRRGTLRHPPLISRGTRGTW